MTDTQFYAILGVAITFILKDMLKPLLDGILKKDAKADKEEDPKAMQEIKLLEHRVNRIDQDIRTMKASQEESVRSLISIDKKLALVCQSLQIKTDGEAL